MLLDKNFNNGTIGEEVVPALCVAYFLHTEPESCQICEQCKLGCVCLEAHTHKHAYTYVATHLEILLMTHTHNYHPVHITYTAS